MLSCGDNYVGKETSTCSNWKDDGNICINILQKQIHWVKNDPMCANLCAFISMLMRVNICLRNTGHMLHPDTVYSIFIHRTQIYSDLKFLHERATAK